MSEHNVKYNYIGLTQNCSVVSDPLVFDGLFYLNSNPDLMDAGMNSVEDARVWKNWILLISFIYKF